MLLKKGCLLWLVHSRNRIQLAFSLCPALFYTPRPNLPVTPGISWLSTFAFQSPVMSTRSFSMWKETRVFRSWVRTSACHSSWDGCISFNRAISQISLQVLLTERRLQHEQWNSGSIIQLCFVWMEFPEVGQDNRLSLSSFSNYIACIAPKNQSVWVLFH